MAKNTTSFYLFIKFKKKKLILNVIKVYRIENIFLAYWLCKFKNDFLSGYKVGLLF